MTQSDTENLIHKGKTKYWNGITPRIAHSPEEKCSKHERKHRTEAARQAALQHHARPDLNKLLSHQTRAFSTNTNLLLFQSSNLTIIFHYVHVNTRIQIILILNTIFNNFLYLVRGMIVKKIKDSRFNYFSQ